MMREIEAILKSSGATAIRLLAAKENPPACRTYENCGFYCVGSKFMYDHDYFAYEKIL